jgi:O-antigen ligase
MRRELLALRILQLGAIAVVLAVSTRHAFELDRFFVPKELVLHATALIAAALIVRRVDLLLAVYLLIGAVSAALATNRWLGLRALAISASGILLMMAARRLREAGLGRPLLGALAFAVVLVAVTSLLQTYGIDVDLFSENRAPGGTLGNRNFVAHAAAFGLPLVLLAAFCAESRGAYLRWSAGATLVIASLVLTRSRAAWLAFGVVMLVIVVSMIISPPLRGRWRRLAGIVVLAGIGVAAALVIPNTLRWRSDNPYLESVQRVADYQQGSGRGRLVQYTQSLKMALRHPLLGVGPGNWPVEYPAHAARHDPSLSDTDGGMTTNPWPSSDWIAFIAERGLAAAVLLGIVFLTIAMSAFRQLRGGDGAEEAAALLATLAGVGITGAFDAVLLLALPTFLVFPAIGALWRAGVPPASRRASSPGGTAARDVPRLAGGTPALLAITLTALGAVRSAAQLTAMEIYATTSDRASLEQAARIDPGNYRLQLRLARMGGRRRCEHARAAHALFPGADEAASLERRCR